MAQAGMAAIPGLKDTYIQLKTRMDKAVEDFRKAMASTRTGRASVHMLDSVSVDYYGSYMPLNQLAQVHAPEPQLITVQPFDPTSLPAIEKAIRAADIGLNPMNDGKIIRVPVPPLTEERRKDMVKHLHESLFVGLICLLATVVAVGRTVEAAMEPRVVEQQEFSVIGIQVRTNNAK